MRTYTKADFIQAMKDAVAERGEDFVYPDEWEYDGDPDAMCEYTVMMEDGEYHGACIIGLAIEKMTGEPYRGDNAPGDQVVADYLGDADLEGPFPDPFFEAVIKAQTVQDMRDPWGVALGRFLEIVGEH